MTNINTHKISVLVVCLYAKHVNWSGYRKKPLRTTLRLVVGIKVGINAAEDWRIEPSTSTHLIWTNASGQASFDH